MASNITYFDMLELDRVAIFLNAKNITCILCNFSNSLTLKVLQYQIFLSKCFQSVCISQYPNVPLQKML